MELQRTVTARGTAAVPDLGVWLELTLHIRREFILQATCKLSPNAPDDLGQCAQRLCAQAQGRPVLQAYLLRADELLTEGDGDDAKSWAVLAELALKQAILQHARQKQTLLQAGA